MTSSRTERDDQAWTDSTPSSEISLVEALRRGDEAAFMFLVSQYETGLMRLARTFVRDDATADEIVQETWLAVLRGIDRFQGRSSLKTWIYRILINRAKTRAVRDARTVPFSSLDHTVGDDEHAVDPSRFRSLDDPRWPGDWLYPPSEWDATPEELALSRETRTVIDDAIAGLPPLQRGVITLRDIEGWSADEVRNALDISETNGRVLLHRARSKVRAALERYLSRELME